MLLALVTTNEPPGTEIREFDPATDPLMREMSFFTEREELALSPEELLIYYRDLEWASWGGGTKSKQTPPREAHPITEFVSGITEELELLATEKAQRVSDLIVEDAHRQGNGSEEIFHRLNPLLKTLQLLKCCKIAVNTHVSRLTDEEYLGGEIVATEFPELPTPTLPTQERIAGNLAILEDVLTKLQSSLSVGSSSEISANLLRQLTSAFERLRFSPSSTDEADAAQVPDSRGSTTWVRGRENMPMAELRELGATVPWSRSAEEFDRTGALFHYDPRLITRFVSMPGAEVIIFRGPSEPPSERGRLLGAFVYFPPEHIPKELRADAAMQPFPVAFDQLMIVHPDARGREIADMMRAAQVVRLQRTNAIGTFGSIPRRNAGSFGTQFKNGASLNQKYQPTARRFDGSEILKRGINALASPDVRELIPPMPEELRRTVLAILAQEEL